MGQWVHAWGVEVVGASLHGDVACQAAGDGVLAAVGHDRRGGTHLGPVPFTIALQSGLQ